MQPCSRRDLLRAGTVGCGLGLAGCLLGDSGAAHGIEQYRADFAKYEDVAAAAADGFEMTTPYVRTGDGALGLTFVKYGVGELSPGEPNGLFYNLRADGTFELLGVKWWVREDEADTRPSLFGREFSGPITDETGTLPDHYALHAWLFDKNPNGRFARYHPGIDPPPYLDELQTVWTELNAYYSNDARAEADGYTNTETCIETDDGAYSIPFVNTERTGTDPGAPAILLYRFSSNWNYRLVGAEWYVPAEASDETPSMFGQPFHESMDGHSPETDQSTHYGLHAWAFMANPAGMFAPFNSLLGC